MFCYASRMFQLGLEGLIALERGRWFLCGWALRPRASPISLTLHGAGGRELPILYESRHPRPDLQAHQRPDVEAFAFHILFAAEEEGRGALTLRAASGPARLAARLGDPALAEDLPTALAARPATANFALLAEARRVPAFLGALLRLEGRPLGGFGPWVSRMAEVPPDAVGLGPLAGMWLAAGPGEDLGLALRSGAPGAWPRRAALGVEWLVELDKGAGAPPGLASVTLDRWEVEELGPGLIAWGRLPPALTSAVRGVEALISLELAGERMQLRARPRRLVLPALFDGLAACALGPAPEPEARAALRAALPRLLDQRAPGALGLLRAGLAGAPDAEAPPLLLISGVEETAGVRLIEALAPHLPAEDGPILISGPAAGDGVAALEAAGRRALAGWPAERLLAEAGERPLRALDLADLAAARLEGRLAALLHDAPPVSAGRLLQLHRQAGAEEGLGATMRRLRAARAGAALPLAHRWRSEDAAPLVARHLSRLWATVERVGG
jgi:hypothetical protein